MKRLLKWIKKKMFKPKVYEWKYSHLKVFILLMILSFNIKSEGQNVFQSNNVYAFNDKPVVLKNEKYFKQSGIIYRESEYKINTSNLPPVGSNTPCNAHRWFAGDGWRQNTSDNTVVNKWEALVLSSPNLQPKGIVRCASSAETESGLEAFKGTYDIASNPIAAILPKTDCYSMTTETFGNNLSAPTQGEDIVWMNFDIRPLAGTYQFQIVSNQNVGFVLYNVDPADAQPITGSTSGTTYPTTATGISGNCNNLKFANIALSGIIHPACGLSGNGWTTITVPSFKKPTNYYLAMWMADENKTSFPNNMNLVYKSRYGCGGATCTLEYEKTSIYCNNNNTYTVCLDYGGSEGRWAIKDETGTATNVSYTTYKQDGSTVISSGSTPTNPLLMTLGTIPDGAVFGKVCATYPLGVAYDLSLTPDTTFKPNNDYFQCADGDHQSGTSPVSSTVIADATPKCTVPTIGVSCIDLTSASHSSNLLISSISPGNISDYTYVWTKPPNARGSLTNGNTSSATYVAAIADAGQELDFIVTATPKDSSKCASTSTVIVLVGTTGSCAVNGPDTICSGSINGYKGSPSPIPTNATYNWVLSGYGGIGSTDATLSGANGNDTITVISSTQSYRITLDQTYANDSLSTSCFVDVLVNPKTTSTTEVSICNNILPYVWNGKNYSLSGTYDTTFIGANQYGCDSTARLVLTVKDTTTSSTPVAVCNNTLPYVWNGANYSLTGTYSKRFPGANAVGCDSVAYLVLTVKDTSTSSTPVAVCNNTLPYVWNGANYSLTGTYSKRFAAANAVGCDSVAYLVLTVKDTSTSSTPVSVCNNTLPYVWNGANYSLTGTYSKRFPAANGVGCDSVAYLVLTVKDTTTSSTPVAVCNNTLPYVWNGANYSLTGTYSKRFPGANAVGCDSVAYLVLTVKDTTTSSTPVAVCNNTLPYVWNGANYSLTGTYSKRFPAANAVGCDSVAYLVLTVKDTSTSLTPVAVCKNSLPYVWNGANYSLTGTYSKRFLAANAVGCDSVAYLVLTVKDTSTSSTPVSVCNNTLPYVWNGANYSLTGTYSKRFAAASAVGCDSVAYLVLTVKDTTTSSTPVAVCNNTLPYVWNGANYSLTGTYSKRFPGANAVGCDSVAYLVLTVKDTTTSSTPVAVCNNTLPYVWNGANYSLTGTYSKRFSTSNAVGCDSVAYLVLTVKDTTTSSTPVAVCNNTLPYVWNGENYSLTGTYSKRFPASNAVGCDSVAYLVLTVKDTTTSSTPVAVCNNTLPYVWNGANYSLSGTYSKRFSGANAVGCDSVAYLVLTVKDTTISSTKVAVCNNTLPYVWNGENYSLSGTYSKRFPGVNAVGCDSVAYLLLTVNDTTTSSIKVAVCNNSLPYVWNGENYSLSGTYSKRFKASNEVGCDSVAYLLLTIRDTSTSTKIDTVCTVPYVWNGANYSLTGTYSKRFPGANSVGCDSVAYLVLTINCPCNGFKTITQGGWGAVPHGGNPGAYLSYPGRFSSVFPTGLLIGCTGGNTLKLTSAQAVTNFLPSGSTPRALPTGNLVNPTRANYFNVFAGQLVALTLNVKMDSAILNFAPSNLNLKDLYITQGVFMGLTVNQLLDEANKKIGGCSSSSYSFSQFNEAADKINNSFDGGVVKNDYLSCQPPTRLTSRIANNQSGDQLDFKIMVSPNPAKYESVLTMNGIIGQVVNISIYDLAGKLLNAEKITLYSNGKNNHLLKLSKYNNQMIVVKVNAGGKTSSTMLVVHH